MMTEISKESVKTSDFALSFSINRVLKQSSSADMHKHAGHAHTNTSCSLRCLCCSVSRFRWTRSGAKDPDFCKTTLGSCSTHVTRKSAAIVVFIVVVLKSHQATVSPPLSSGFVSPPKAQPGRRLRSPAGRGDECRVNRHKRAVKKARASEM